MVSRKELEAILGKITADSIAEAGEQGMDLSGLRKVHQQKLAEFVAEYELKVPQWRIDCYLGNVYMGMPEDRAITEEEAARSRQMAGAETAVDVFLADQFPPEIKFYERKTG